MGKLTDSLREATAELDEISTGINKMAELSEDLAHNTVDVAEKALRVGYHYAKAEEQVQPEPLPGDGLEEERLRMALESASNSQKSLQTWNDIYRIQKVLAIQYLKQAGADRSVIQSIEEIFKLNSIKQAPNLGMKLLNFDRSEVLKLLRKVVNHSKHLLQD